MILSGTYTGEELMEMQRLLSVSTVQALKKLSHEEKAKRTALLAQQAVSGQERALTDRALKHRVVGWALMGGVPLSVPPRYRPEPEKVRFMARRELLTAETLIKKAGEDDRGE